MSNEEKLVKQTWLHLSCCDKTLESNNFTLLIEEGFKGNKSRFLIYNEKDSEQYQEIWLDKASALNVANAILEHYKEC